MGHPMKSIGLAALISFAILTAFKVLPGEISRLSDSEWLLLLLSALAVSIYLITNTYLMSRQLESVSNRK